VWLSKAEIRNHLLIFKNSHCKKTKNTRKIKEFHKEKFPCSSKSIRRKTQNRAESIPLLCRAFPLLCRAWRTWTPLFGACLEKMKMKMKLKMQMEKEKEKERERVWKGKTSLKGTVEWRLKLKFRPKQCSLQQTR
jgi:hypothetical protein